jgi:hypothetical protein
MKKIMSVGISVIVCLVCIGCATTGSLDKQTVIAPLGILSVTSNNEITWYGEEQKSEGILGNALRKAAKEQLNEKPGDLVVMAEGILHDALMGQGIEVVDTQRIISSDAYTQAKEDSLTKASGILTPDGYRYVAAKNSDLIKDLGVQTGVKSGLYVYFDFSKMISTGVAKNGTAKACVSMNTTLVNSDGKIIFQKSFFKSSADTFTVVAGIYNPESLMKQYPDVIQEICNEFALQIMR